MSDPQIESLDLRITSLAGDISRVADQLVQISEYIGDLDTLDTTNRTSLTDAINAVSADVEALQPPGPGDVYAIQGQVRGARVYYGPGGPVQLLGRDGDFYLASDTYALFGPKKDGVWPAPVFLRTYTSYEVDLSGVASKDQADAIKGVVDGIAADVAALADASGVTIDLSSVALESSVQAIKAVADQVKTHTDTLHNADLSAIATSSVLAAVKTVVDAIQVHTDSLHNTDTSTLSTAVAVAAVKTVVDAIKTHTDALANPDLSGLATATALAAVQTTVNSISGAVGGKTWRTYSYDLTSHPSGTASLAIPSDVTTAKGWGTGAGGGGGANATSNSGAGGGGGSGRQLLGGDLMVAPGSTLPITIGAPGSAGIAAAGGNGGASTIGNLINPELAITGGTLTLPGGQGGGKGIGSTQGTAGRGCYVPWASGSGNVADNANGINVTSQTGAWLTNILGTGSIFSAAGTVGGGTTYNSNTPNPLNPTVVSTTKGGTGSAGGQGGISVFGNLGYGGGYADAASTGDGSAVTGYGSGGNGASANAGSATQRNGSAGGGGMIKIGFWSAT